jgi:hypothetical protein
MARKNGNFSLFELWRIHKLEIVVSVHPSGIETLNVWGLVMGDANCEQVRDLLEELRWHVAGGNATVKTRYLWVLELGTKWQAIYGEDEGEVEYQAAIMDRAAGPRVELMRCPLGRGEFPVAITMVSYEAQRVPLGMGTVLGR